MASQSDLNLPIVDFSYFQDGSSSERLFIANALVAAMRTVGFVYVAGLDDYVPQTQIDRMFDFSKRFFALPEETKLKAPHPKDGAHHRGYSGLGREKVTSTVFDSDEERAQVRAAVPDMKESYEYGKDTEDAALKNIKLPEEDLPGFAKACDGFFWLCDKFVKTAVLPAIALGLSAPEDYFLSYHTESENQLRLLHYPSVSIDDVEEKRLARISTHSDYGTLTILFQNETGGLEVETKEGVFVHVVPIPGTVVLNTAQFLTRWTNDILKSTLHRVRAPPSVLPGGQTGERYSIPYFVGPNPSAKVTTLQTCISEERPEKYTAAVTVGEYINERLANNY